MEHPWDSMRSFHMCVVFIAVSAAPRIIVTIVAWAGPFLLAPQFILEALLPQVPKPLLWLRLRLGKSGAMGLKLRENLQETLCFCTKYRDVLADRAFSHFRESSIQFSQFWNA